MIETNWWLICKHTGRMTDTAVLDWWQIQSYRTDDTNSHPDWWQVIILEWWQTQGPIYKHTRLMTQLAIPDWWQVIVPEWWQIQAYRTDIQAYQTDNVYRRGQPPIRRTMAGRWQSLRKIEYVGRGGLAFEAHCIPGTPEWICRTCLLSECVVNKCT